MTTTINTNDYTQMTRLSTRTHTQVKAMAKANGTTMSRIIESLLENAGTNTLMLQTEIDQGKKMRDLKRQVAILELEMEY